MGKAETPGAASSPPGGAPVAAPPPAVPSIAAAQDTVEGSPSGGDEPKAGERITLRVAPGRTIHTAPFVAGRRHGKASVPGDQIELDREEGERLLALGYLEPLEGQRGAAAASGVLTAKSDAGPRVTGG